MSLADDLAQKGWSVQADYFTPHLIAGLHKDLQDRQDSGLLRAAGIGRGTDFQIVPDIRNDVTQWLDASSKAQQDYLAMMEGVQAELNRHLFLGLSAFEAHYALYEPGGFYKKHVDALKGAQNRIVSTVTYLTPDWTEDDAGHLVLYDDENKELTRVLPRAGTLVVFMSEEIPHEVLPPTRARCSIAGWFRRHSP